LRIILQPWISKPLKISSERSPQQNCKNIPKENLLKNQRQVNSREISCEILLLHLNYLSLTRNVFRIEIPEIQNQAYSIK
jgi:hypothetical protein